MRLKELENRLRLAASFGLSCWVAISALIAAAGAAWLLVRFTPSSGADVVAAKDLGIVSSSILAGYSKAADQTAYFLALGGALLVSSAIWVGWAIGATRRDPSFTEPNVWSVPRLGKIELSVATLLALALFTRWWNGHAATFSSWSLMVEEGEMLAWIDVVMRGGALSRDVFCLYGPLSSWAVAGLFSVFGPSIGLWRHWIFALNGPAVLAVYLLLRGITRTRTASIAGTLLVTLICAAPIPAMSWSLARVGLALAALATLTRALDRKGKGWYIATGALIATALLYSQEVGIACTVAVGIVLLFQGDDRIRSIVWTAAGAAIVLVPAIIYLVATQSLGPTIDNLFLFPRIRMLGFAAHPFPPLSLKSETLRGYFIPTVLAVSGFVTATKLLRGQRDARTWIEVGLFLLGAILFTAALSRPDDAHFPFVAPPVLVLLAMLVDDAFFALSSPAHRAAAVAAAIAALATLLPWATMARDNLLSYFEPPSGRRLDLPRGGSALLPDEFARDLEKVTRAVQSRTAPAEPIWVYPNEALLYFLVDRPQPTHFPDAVFAVTRAQRQQLVAQLDKARPRWVIVFLQSPEIDGIPYEVTMPEVADYLVANYAFDESIGGFALYRRKS